MDQSYTSIISESSTKPIVTEYDTVHNYVIPSTSYKRLFEEKKVEKGNKLKNGKTEKVLKTIQVKEKKPIINEKKPNPYLKLPNNHLHNKNELFNTSNIHNESFYRDVNQSKNLFYSTLKFDKKGSNEEKLNSINVSRINNGEVEESNFDPVDDELLFDKIKSKVNKEELGDGPVKVTVVTKKKIVQTNADLTPLPKARKSELVNKLNQHYYHEAERTTVQIRRNEYANSMSEQVVMLKKDFVFFNDPVRIGRIKQIQIWWKKIFKLNKAARRIQSFYKGYIIRTRFNFIMEGMKHLNMQLSQFVRNIKIVYLRNVYNLLKNTLKNRIELINKSIYIQAKVRRFLLHKKVKRDKTISIHTVLSLTVYKRIRYAFYKINNYANMQFHMKLIQKFIKDNLKGFNINFLRNSDRYKEACIKLRKGMKYTLFKHFLVMIKKFIKLRKKENAQKIYRKKMIINKNHFFKIFAKFFNRWRGISLTKSPSLIKKEMIGKMSELTQMFNFLRKLFIKRVKMNKLIRYILKKYLNSVLKKFHYKFQTIKKKFDNKRKKQFFNILKEISSGSKKRNEECSFNMKKMFKLYKQLTIKKINNFYYRWKKINFQIKDNHNQAVILCVKKIKKIMINRIDNSRVIEEIKSFKNNKLIQTKLKILLSKLHSSTNIIMTSLFKKFKYNCAKAISNDMRNRLLQIYLKKILIRNDNFFLEKFFNRWEYVNKSFKIQITHYRKNNDLTNSISLLKKILFSPFKSFLKLLQKHKNIYLFKQKFTKYMKVNTIKTLRNKLLKWLFNSINTKAYFYENYLRSKQIKDLIIKKYLKIIKIYISLWKNNDSVMLKKIKSFSSIFMQIIKRNIYRFVFKVLYRKSLHSKLNKIILRKTKHDKFKACIKCIIIWKNTTLFTTNLQIECYFIKFRLFVGKLFKKILVNIKKEFLILHIYRKNCLRKIIDLFKSQLKSSRINKCLYRLFIDKNIKSVSILLIKGFNKWRYNIISLNIYEAGKKITNFLRRKMKLRNQRQIHNSSKINKILKKILLLNFKLRFYFEGWKKIIEKIQDKNNKRKISHLKSFFIRLEKKYKALMTTNFIFWNNFSINKVILSSTLLIQRFLKTKLFKLRQDKIEAKDIIRSNVLNSAINRRVKVENKMNILKSLQKWKLLMIAVKIKSEIITKYINSLIIKEKTVISIHFQKWRSLIFLLTNNEKANIIQQAFRSKKIRSNNIEFFSKFLYKLTHFFIRKLFGKLKDYSQKQAEINKKEMILKSIRKKKNDSIKRLISRRFIQISRLDYFKKWADKLMQINLKSNNKLKTFFNHKGKSMKIYLESFFLRWRNKSCLYDFIDRSNMIKRNYFLYLFRKRLFAHRIKNFYKNLSIRYDLHFITKTSKLIKFVSLLRIGCYRILLSTIKEKKLILYGCDKIHNILKNRLKLCLFSLKCSYNKSKCQIIESLRSMFRRFFLINLSDYAKEYSRYDNLMYFLNVTLLHKNMNEIKLQREIILRWRYQIMMKKISNSKLYFLYKNMQNLCDNIAEDMFGDNKGILEEVYNEIDLINLKFQLTNSTKKYLSKSLPRADRFDQNFNKSEAENLSFISFNQPVESKKSLLEDDCFSFSANSSFRQDQNID